MLRRLPSQGPQGRARHHDLHEQGFPNLDRSRVSRIRRRTLRASLHQRNSTVRTRAAHLPRSARPVCPEPNQDRRPPTARCQRRDSHEQPRRVELSALVERVHSPFDRGGGLDGSKQLSRLGNPRNRSRGAFGLLDRTLPASGHASEARRHPEGRLCLAPIRRPGR